MLEPVGQKIDRLGQNGHRMVIKSIDHVLNEREFGMRIVEQITAVDKHQVVFLYLFLDLEKRGQPAIPRRNADDAMVRIPLFKKSQPAEQLCLVAQIAMRRCTKKVECSGGRVSFYLVLQFVGLPVTVNISKDIAYFSFYLC